MSLPVVKLTGTPYEQGTTHGRELKNRIAHNLEVYFERFAREVGLPRAEVLGIAGQYAKAIARQNPDYHAQMRGVSDGSGFAFDEIAALNVRYEILYYQFGKLATESEEAAKGALNAEGRADGCTAFAALGRATKTGHLLMGQNWDWIPDVQGAVLHTHDNDNHETLAYTESGIIGAKIGFNSVGIGLAINGMTTTADDWSRLAKPFHVRCFEILRARRFDDAIRVITDEARSCSTNFLVAQTPDRVMDIEAAPDKVNLLSCDEAGCLTHANHFVAPDALGVEEAPNERRIYSRRRQARLRELLGERMPLTVENIQDALKDTQDDPFGVCRHRNLEEPPEMHYTTVTAVVMDLDARTLYLTDGPPDEAPFQTVTMTAAEPAP